jgi:outer membrane biosynthesis protein TonB
MVADRKGQQFPVRPAMAQAIKKQREFPLPLALLISVALHGLLLLISLFWVPFSLSTPAAQEPEESVLRFAFAPTEDAEQDTAPQGDVPFETPPQQPETVADYEPSGLPSLLPPSSPAPPVPELEPSDEERPIEEMDERIDEEQPIEEPTEAQQEAETEIPEFPTETDATYRADPDAERSTTGSRQDEQLDLGQAIRDFSDAVARARASNPPSSGGGSPRNVFVPDPGDVPTTGFGVGNLMFESRDYDWTEYARSIYWEIWKAWHRRLYHGMPAARRVGHGCAGRGRPAAPTGRLPPRPRGRPRSLHRHRPHYGHAPDPTLAALQRLLLAHAFFPQQCNVILPGDLTSRFIVRPSGGSRPATLDKARGTRTSERRFLRRVQRCQRWEPAQSRSNKRQHGRTSVVGKSGKAEQGPADRTVWVAPFQERAACLLTAVVKRRGSVHLAGARGSFLAIQPRVRPARFAMSGRLAPDGPVGEGGAGFDLGGRAPIGLSSSGGRNGCERMS